LIRFGTLTPQFSATALLGFKWFSIAFEPAYLVELAVDRDANDGERGIVESAL